MSRAAAGTANIKLVKSSILSSFPPDIFTLSCLREINRDIKRLANAINAANSPLPKQPNNSIGENATAKKKTGSIKGIRI